ncbi:MAG: hypothetical protein GXP41_04785 [Chloroflexi bacterium]|nr:hypothetical protein [Chloroflexota bacterium]
MWNAQISGPASNGALGGPVAECWRVPAIREEYVDITQATQMITWLDKEHRRDRALLTDVRQRLESQTVEISEQAKRVQELEGRLAATQAKLTKFTQLEQALQRLKDEMGIMTQRQDEARQKAQKEEAQLRQLERENTSRALNDIRQQLEELPAIQEQLSLQKAEDRRLSETLLTLQAQTADFKQTLERWPERIAFLENQRQQDNKRLTQVQQESAELIRRTEAQIAKLELLEETVRRNEQSVAALNAMRDEMRQEQAHLSENLKLKEGERDRQMQEWTQAMAKYEEQRKRHAAQIERFARQSEDIQHALKSLQLFREEMRRDQNQVSEVQRLAEERLQTQFEEWQAENEQRWTRSKLEFEGRWNRQNALNDEMGEQLKLIRDWRRQDVDTAQQTIKRLTEAEAAFRAAIAELWRAQEKEATQSLEENRRRAARIGEQVRKYLEG